MVSDVSLVFSSYLSVNVPKVFSFKDAALQFKKNILPEHAGH